MTDFTKLDGKSLDIEEKAKERLKNVFPECFSEGKLNIDKLLSLCGEYIDNDVEKYKFEWKGKSKCYRIAGKRSTGTLRPCPQESVDFDKTNNLYIEGDNLEVLKLLQTTYYRKVKMIYIDPPYNTGNDFVYEDDFKDPLAKYKEITSQTTKSNPETMGRYHTNWLNMMYPRLRLAANLLRDDGVIFISIDDNEVTNLRRLCDEVFGEENFVDCITWNKRVPKNDNKGIGNIHEYILVYVKDLGHQRQFLMQKDGLDEIFDFLDSLKKKKTPIPEAEAELKKFYNKKGYDRGITLYNNLDNNYQPWGKINMSWPNGETFGPKYDVIHPATKKATKVPDRGWRWNKNTFDEQLDYDNAFQRYDNSWVCGNIWFAKDEKTQPSSIKYLKDVSTMLLRSIISLKSDGGFEVENIFDGKSYFSYPKPTSLLKLLINSLEEKEGIFLDFFSGSATTAHAVMALNAEDGGNRQFIMVQLPELTDEKSEAFKAGYKNICEIGKERIRRAGSKIKEEYLKNHLALTGHSSTGGELCEAASASGHEYQLFPSRGGVAANADGVVSSRNTKNYLKLPYNPALTEKAKELRKAGNLSEVLLWNQIKNKQFKGLDFDRQKIIGNYIVDFYCPSRNVVIEIDGYSHDNKADYDNIRDNYLKDLGLTVIHILDSDVKNNIEGVMMILKNHASLTTPSLCDTPPQEGNGVGNGTLSQEGNGVRNGTLSQEGNGVGNGTPPQDGNGVGNGTLSQEGNGVRNGTPQILDTGFKVLKLDTSNLVKWDDTPTDSETDLFNRMDGMEKSLKNDRSDLDVVFEVMLKIGIPPTYKINELNVNGRKVYSIGDDGLVLICLDGTNGGIAPEDVSAMCDLAPAKIIAAEEAFKDDIALSNAFYISKDKGIEVELL